MDAGFEIRALTPADVQAFRGIRLEGLQRAPHAFGSSPEALAETSDETLIERIAGGPRSTAFGAFDGEALIGVAGFSAEEQAKFRHRGWMWGVYVTGAARGRGVADALVAAVIAHARTQVRVLRADVGAANEPAKRVYARAGFVSFGVDRKVLHVDGQDIDEELLRIDF